MGAGAFARRAAGREGAAGALTGGCRRGAFLRANSRVPPSSASNRSGSLKDSLVPRNKTPPGLSE